MPKVFHPAIIACIRENRTASQQELVAVMASIEADLIVGGQLNRPSAVSIFLWAKVALNGNARDREVSF